jgi:hypothetical protein
MVDSKATTGCLDAIADCTSGLTRRKLIFLLDSLLEARHPPLRIIIKHLRNFGLKPDEDHHAGVTPIFNQPRDLTAEMCRTGNIAGCMENRIHSMSRTTYYMRKALCSKRIKLLHCCNAMYYERQQKSGIIPSILVFHIRHTAQRTLFFVLPM